MTHQKGCRENAGREGPVGNIVAANYSRVLQSNPGYPVSEHWATRGNPGRTSAA